MVTIASATVTGGAERDLTLVLGKADGRYLNHAIRVFSDNPGAQKDGQAMLAKLSQAVGVIVSNGSELAGRTVRAKVAADGRVTDYVPVADNDNDPVTGRRPSPAAAPG